VNFPNEISGVELRACTQPKTVRLAAIDIDGTLLGPDGRISAANAAAVRRLVARGIRVTLASGRSHANMLPFYRALGLKTAVISAHGALVRDSITGDVWYEQRIPAETAERVVRMGRRLGLTPSVYTAEGAFLEQRNALTDWDQSRNSIPHVIVDDLLQVVANGAHKLMWLGEPARIAEIAPGAVREFAGLLTAMVTDPEYVEFTAYGVDKASGLAATARHYGVAREEVAAFGDGNNDAPMLAWAGYGVAMPHGSPSARSAARYIAPAGNPEDALARAIDCLFSSR
jgi:Cof subfamily protein (haloacid dehalogenase superfamily)